MNPPEPPFRMLIFLLAATGVVLLLRDHMSPHVREGHQQQNVEKPADSEQQSSGRSQPSRTAIASSPLIPRPSDLRLPPVSTPDSDPDPNRSLVPELSRRITLPDLLSRSADDQWIRSWNVDSGEPDLFSDWVQLQSGTSLVRFRVQRKSEQNENETRKKGTLHLTFQTNADQSLPDQIQVRGIPISPRDGEPFRKSIDILGHDKKGPYALTGIFSGSYRLVTEIDGYPTGLRKDIQISPEKGPTSLEMNPAEWNQSNVRFGQIVLDDLDPANPSLQVLIFKNVGSISSPVPRKFIMEAPLSENGLFPLPDRPGEHLAIVLTLPGGRTVAEGVYLPEEQPENKQPPLLTIDPGT